jgi:membrane protein
MDRGAALSYYFLFALFPALLFMTALLGFLPIPDLWDRLMGYVQQVLPGDSATMIQKTLGEVVSRQRGGLLSIGALTALWAASNGMASVMTALNVAYDLDEVRPWWKRRLLAVGLTIGFSFLLLAALVLLVFGGKIGTVAADWLGLGGVFTMVWNAASILIAVVAVLVGIALVYYLAPAGEQRWQWVTPGSAVALVLWLAMSFGLRAYVTYFGNYNATYGSIGGVILLMLWLYLTGVVLLLGAEVNAEIEHAAARAGEPTAKAAGEHVAPADRGVPQSRDTSDAVLTARFVSRQTRTLQREGWLPVLAVAGAAVAGWLMSRRPVGDVARRSARAVETGRQVAAAIAARERLRHPPGSRRAA